ncbi:hypothetical protein NKH17_32700, partial [Mesorhizobium sp. M1334]
RHRQALPMQIQYHHHLPDLDHRNPSPDHQEKHQRLRAAGLPERAPEDRRQRYTGEDSNGTSGEY